MASMSWTNYGPTPPAPSPSNTGQRKSQTRQLLSCTKCRERKVKCDRTKPCSACCVRGHPKECEFIVGEGNDYSPIQQSYEIRKLREENQRLKGKLQAARLSHSDEEDDDDGQSLDKVKAAPKASSAWQRRLKTNDRNDNLYFGTPGLASVVSDFARLHVGSHSLTHPVPKGKDMYANDNDAPAYPFPVVPNCSTILSLLCLLPTSGKLFAYLEIFQQRAQSCSFPHIPDEVTRKEIERFLADKESNAEKCPDMLALLFMTLATGLQMGQYDRSGKPLDLHAAEETRQESDAFLAASMQCLRLASFMNRPTLLGIQTLVMMGPYLTNSGRFLDAWTLFGTTIRLAHSVGLHRNPKLLDPVPSLPECAVRQTLWWWMLHMDQQYSVTLGRPLGISGFGDCPPAERLTTNPTELRLGAFITHFTVLARQILSSDGIMSAKTIDDFTDKLLGMWDTMPAALQFNESWTHKPTVLPEWPLDVTSTMLFAKVQSFLVLLNRQRVERTSHSASESPPNMSNAMFTPSHAAPVRGRVLVINSCVGLLQTFMFFYHRQPACLICWTLGQQAFNACMILLLDAWETCNENNEWYINQAYAVFVELERNGVHKIARLAVEKVSDWLVKLEQRRDARMRESRRAFAGRPRNVNGTQRHQQQLQQPQLTLDTASMTTDFRGDTVMGNTGMFLLEDPGLQSFLPTSQTFQPLSWQMAGSPTTAWTSNQPSPSIPVSQVTVAQFPAMSPPYMSSAIPVTNAPRAVGLQPWMPTASGSSRRRRTNTASKQPTQYYRSSATSPPTSFTAINQGFRSYQ